MKAKENTTLSEQLKKIHTVGTVQKYNTVGTVQKYHTVGTVQKYHTVGTVQKYHTVGTVQKSNRIIVEIEKSIYIATKYKTAYIPGFEHALQWQVAKLNSFYGHKSSNR